MRRHTPLSDYARHMALYGAKTHLQGRYGVTEPELNERSALAFLAAGEAIFIAHFSDVAGVTSRPILDGWHWVKAKPVPITEQEQSYEISKLYRPGT